MKNTVGKTQDVGFQCGLQKTFLISEEKAWDFMFSDVGLKIWLGVLETNFSVKEKYSTKSGIEGFVRVLEPHSHIRLNWKMKHWENMSTFQVRIIGKSEHKTLISFHQEKLLDSNQRAEMKEYWNDKMTKLSEAIEKVNDEN